MGDRQAGPEVGRSLGGSGKGKQPWVLSVQARQRVTWGKAGEGRGSHKAPGALVRGLSFILRRLGQPLEAFEWEKT